MTMARSSMIFFCATNFVFEEKAPLIIPKRAEENKKEMAKKNLSYILSLFFLQIPFDFFKFILNISQAFLARLDERSALADFFQSPLHIHFLLFFKPRDDLLQLFQRRAEVFFFVRHSVLYDSLMVPSFTVVTIVPSATRTSIVSPLRTCATLRTTFPPTRAMLYPSCNCRCGSLAKSVFS